VALGARLKDGCLEWRGKDWKTSEWMMSIEVSRSNELKMRALFKYIFRIEVDLEDASSDFMLCLRKWRV